MSLQLTSDPIVTEAQAAELLKVSGDEARMLINSASEKFLAYTNRTQILSAEVTEYQRGQGLSVFWTRVTPVTAITSVQRLSDGDVAETYTEYEYDAPTGRFALYSAVVPFSYAERNLKLVYTAGWTEANLPGDILAGALELMRYEQTKLVKARAGVKSESLDGHSVTFETGALPEAVRRAWDNYRILV